MISRADLEALIRRDPTPDGHVLSVYLDIDQSTSSNLNRGFEVKLRSWLRDLEASLEDRGARKELAGDAASVLSFASSYQPKGKTLVVFCDASERFFWQREVYAPLRQGVRWEDRPYVRPLQEALDEYERYGVILIDKSHARLFTVYLGEIEEHREAFSPAPVKHIKSPGTEHIRSQTHIQRTADMHLLWHVKNVAGIMEQLADQNAFDRLVLAGPVEATSELRHQLPERLSRRVVDVLHLPIDAPEQAVLQETQRVEREFERGYEERVIQELITAAAKGQQAVTGFEATLESLNEGRILRLVFAEGFARAGSECKNCRILALNLDGSCGYCGAELSTVEDLVDRVIQRVLDQGGRAEEVRERAAAELGTVGGIGALLRF